jgi:SAM-dependent methyltransferase
MVESDFAFACPECTTALSSGLKCMNCGRVFEMTGGIYRFLLPERSAEIQPFLAQYQLVRESDGNRSFRPDGYRKLPDLRADSPQADIWRIRRESYGRLISLLDERTLSILDIGAGNGWLSHRLVTLGHCPVAVDWLDDVCDGLSAYCHYPVQYTSVQADFNALPFIASQFDVVIFNASLHYSGDIQATLRHACNMMKRQGRIFIMDSPTFSSDISGQTMVREHIERLRKSYGLHDVIQPGVGYLNIIKMVEVGRALGIAFQFYPSHGTLLWEAKRLWAGIKNRRESAGFGVLEGKLL